MSEKPLPVRVEVDVPAQRLRVVQGGATLHEYAVSTASAGTGQQRDSGCTPLGRHRVRIKIGAAAPLNSVFVGRRPTGEIYTDRLAVQHPDRDWILTRILWLTGLEPGVNRGGECDSLRRYIYIHGTPDSEPMGVPASHGCIRMRNEDLLALFDLVDPGTEVLIRG
jgi:lipoprotein-anchoring transpeptidase ErfK/SrfK